ncbi:rhodanese-like domain-containing protein [Geoalkalibacter ferrihydriticus]|nr:hypothetical protein [Geoalkalibacter ferrihydriticus]
MKLKALLVVLVALIFVGCSTTYTESQSVPRMSVAELNERLGESDLVIIDNRTPGEWERTQIKIAGAVRENPGSINWAGMYAKGSTLVLYCA